MGLLRTVREGDRIAVWSKNGTVKVVEGPQRVSTFGKRVEVLRKHYADHTEYLLITERDGRVSVQPGPIAVWTDPVIHDSIAVKKAILVDASEALVVYKGGSNETVRKAPSSREVVRRIVRGPARFIPDADEWIHTFEWTGQPTDGSKTSYQPKALRFTHLPVVSGSRYHNVTEVRTNDDTLVTVKLMLFFELRDIDKMLDATADPIGDFINAASADVIAFCAAANYETFLNETYKLNELATFSQLVSRAQHIGYQITKVVFRGFQAGDKLQAMHDGAIQERTRLRLLEETQAAQQRAADLELHAKQRRAAQQAELAAAEAAAAADMSMVARKAALAEQTMADEAAVAKERLQHEALLERERAAREASLAHERQTLELLQARNAEQLTMMRGMHALGVDLTKVLVSQHEQPDKVIKLETNTGAGDAAGGPTTSGAGVAGKGLLGALQLNL